MQRMTLQPLQCQKMLARARIAVLAMVLSVLAGCATTNTKVEQKPAAVPTGPSVARLVDGREGFTITEPNQMDAESRRDFERAVTMMQDEDYDKAIELLEKVMEQSPGVTAPYIDIAMAYEHVDKLKEAEKSLKTALELIPDHPVASNEYGLLLRKTGRFTEARTIYEKTLAAFPEYLPAHRNLGILCDLYLDDPQCALEQYEIYSKAVPEDKQVKIWIADLRLRLKDHKSDNSK
ncbi:MAG: tetratricopeptide repeat protein [Deltaproteobacteria bacterium]